MNNPYKVLGVNEGASQEEIRSAYLKLVKKYHPDKYTDSDLKELANEKLVEVNEAYEMLTKKNGQSSSYANRNGNGTYDSYSGGYTGSGSSYSGPNAQEFNRARAFINQNNLQAAKAVLDAISTRNAEWYYLYGIIYLRQGWYDKAREYLTIAYQQEPHNPEYAAAYSSIKNSGGAYTRSTGNYGSYNCSPCPLCASMLCCSSMGGMPYINKKNLIFLRRFGFYSSAALAILMSGIRWRDKENEVQRIKDTAAGRYCRGSFVFALRCGQDPWYGQVGGFRRIQNNRLRQDLNNIRWAKRCGYPLTRSSGQDMGEHQ